MNRPYRKCPVPVAFLAGHGRPAIRDLRQDVLGRETGAAGFCLLGLRACPPLAGCPRAAGGLGGAAEEHPQAWAGVHISKQYGYLRGAEQPLWNCFDSRPLQKIEYGPRLRTVLFEVDD